MESDGKVSDHAPSPRNAKASNNGYYSTDPPFDEQKPISQNDVPNGHGPDSSKKQAFLMAINRKLLFNRYQSGVGLY